MSPCTVKSRGYAQRSDGEGGGGRRREDQFLLQDIVLAQRDGEGGCKEKRQQAAPGAEYVCKADLRSTPV